MYILLTSQNCNLTWLHCLGNLSSKDSIHKCACKEAAAEAI